MNPIQSLILGIVQGLTEFIPVSSSGHLQLIPQLVGWQVPSTIFVLFTNLGTLLALVIYFRQELWQFGRAVVVFCRNRFKVADPQNQKQLSLLAKILIATIPAGLIGLVVNKFVDSFYTNASSTDQWLITAMAMIMVGVVFTVSDYIFQNAKINLDKISPLQAILIGFSQALAFIRGVSRSGITMLTAGILGFDKLTAAKFSFLMSIPISLATTLLAFKDLFSLPAGQLQTEAVSSGIGLLAAFISGYLAIKFLLQFLQKNGLTSFGWYRIIFGAAAILVMIFR